MLVRRLEGRNQDCTKSVAEISRHEVTVAPTIFLPWLTLGVSLKACLVFIAELRMTTVARSHRMPPTDVPTVVRCRGHPLWVRCRPYHAARNRRQGSLSCTLNCGLTWRCREAPPLDVRRHAVNLQPSHGTPPVGRSFVRPQRLPRLRFDLRGDFSRYRGERCIATLAVAFDVGEKQLHLTDLPNL